MDCVRLLCRSSHELLQKVPTVVQEVFRINSTEPGSFLLEASRQFQVLIIIIIQFLTVLMH
jgi:hypothetical protein